MTKRNKELVEELAESQNKSNKTSGNDDSRVSKLSKAVNTKTKENKELADENIKLKKSNEELLKKFTDVSGKVSILETANTRLENQVDNLIEAVGKKNKDDPKTKVGAGREKTNNESEKKQPSGRKSEDNEQSKTIKCRHNDKSSCNRGNTCFDAMTRTPA